MAARHDHLRRHIDQLCLEHDIQIRERRRSGGVAIKRQRVVSIRPVKTERTYIIALHEIGHIVGRNRSGRRLEQEAAAWDYVIEQSIVPLSTASYEFMEKALLSYLNRARFTGRRMVIPEQGHRFWSTFEVITARSSVNITEEPVCPAVR
jgi:hypothetical protein